MKQASHSRTAILAAWARAYHFTHEKQKIFADPLAHLFVKPTEQDQFETLYIDALAKLRPDLEVSSKDRITLLRKIIQASVTPLIFLTRSRYIEDKLTKEIERGIRQYVIIGAGFDTYAFRQPTEVQLQVFEIDHPSTQSLKRKRLADAGLETPAHLHLVAADLERESVATALKRTPFDVGAPTFFAWPGVTYYLTHNAIKTTLHSVRSIAAAGSKIIFDYLESDAFNPDKVVDRIRLAMENVRNMGEPWFSGFAPETIGAELSALGFTLLEDLSPAMLQERFLQNLPGGYRAAEHFHFAHAQVQ